MKKTTFVLIGAVVVILLAALLGPLALKWSLEQDPDVTIEPIEKFEANSGSIIYGGQRTR